MILQINQAPIMNAVTVCITVLLIVATTGTALYLIFYSKRKIEEVRNGKEGGIPIWRLPSIVKALKIKDSTQSSITFYKDDKIDMIISFGGDENRTKTIGTRIVLPSHPGTEKEKARAEA